MQKKQLVSAHAKCGEAAHTMQHWRGTVHLSLSGSKQCVALVHVEETNRQWHPKSHAMMLNKIKICFKKPQLNCLNHFWAVVVLLLHWLMMQLLWHLLLPLQCWQKQLLLQLLLLLLLHQQAHDGDVILSLLLLLLSQLLSSCHAFLLLLLWWWCCHFFPSCHS